MTYRMLRPDEWSRLEPVFAKYGHRIPPHPQTGLPVMVAIAENDAGEIKGLQVFQPAFHVEPLVLEDKHVNFKSLMKVLLEDVADKAGLNYYVFTEHDVTERMAEHVGFERLPYAVWRKEIR